MIRMIFPLVLGLVGASILVGLGAWQLQRLTWKEAILAEIDARITAEPGALPDHPDPATDLYLPVEVNGRFTGEDLDVLVSRKGQGAGYRVIAAFETDTGRRILIDRGFLPEALRNIARAEGAAQVFGNLHWPDEVDSYTPAPDAARKIWFARDLPAMAAELGTEEALVVMWASTYPGDAVQPLPVDSAAIPNDHLQYAITWFLLAVVWVGMTALLMSRIWRRKA